MKLIFDKFDLDGNLVGKPAEEAFPHIVTDEQKIEFFNLFIASVKECITEDANKETPRFSNLIEEENGISVDALPIKRHIICKLEEE